jgi:hypothetical protein
VVLVDKSTGAAITSGTVTVYITKDGGAQATIAGSAVHEGNGQWSFNLTAGEMNADVVGLAITHTSIAPLGITIKTLDLNTIADAILSRDLGSGSGVGTLNERTVRSALRFLRNRWSLSGTTLTVTKEDDASAAWTSTVTTVPGADPVTGSDPA